MIGLWLLLAATPIMDEGRLVALEQASERGLTELGSGCRAVEIDLVQRGRIGLLRRSESRWRVDAELREGQWRFITWNREARRGDLAGYDDWPFVQPGAGRTASGEDALVRFLGSFDVPSTSSWAMAEEDGSALLEQRLTLKSDQGRAQLELTTTFAPDGRARTWSGRVRGPLPHARAPLDGLHWRFEVDDDGVPLREHFETTVRLTTTSVHIESDASFEVVGACR